jgi:hypothetical protein
MNEQIFNIIAQHIGLPLNEDTLASLRGNVQTILEDYSRMHFIEVFQDIEVFANVRYNSVELDLKPKSGLTTERFQAAIDFIQKHAKSQRTQ